MKRACQKCGEIYSLGQFSVDSGFCSQCKPGFLGKPLWLQSSQAGTRDLWRMLLVVHAILYFLFGLLLDMGELSRPGGMYCLTIVIYLSIRFVVARFKGYPIHAKTQAVVLCFLPVWGPLLFVALFYWAQRMRWGT